MTLVSMFRLVVIGIALVCSSDAFASVTATHLAGPVTFGSPDQPWGKRRPVTDADRVAIRRYRSGHKQAIYSTRFADPATFKQDWDVVTDDNNNNSTFQSCRRPASVETSSVGLRLKTLIATDCHASWSTGYIASKAKYSYGFFEATMKIADITGMNNAFWLTTDDNFEIDVAEAQYPNYAHLALQYWPRDKDEKHAGIGWGAKFADNLSYGFHDMGMLWTPTDIIYEVDGEPVAAVRAAVKGRAAIRFSTTLGSWAGKVPEHPEGHNMVVQSVRVFAP
jgi:hypothetical protein